MRFWLTLLLTVLLPLQLSWAQAAAYCRHDAPHGTAHQGHHQHRQHGPGQVGEASGGESRLTDLDADCSACHAACASALPAHLCPFAGAAETPGLPAATPPPRYSHTCAPPDRPNWRAPA
ncbi:hypothetical protein [Pulveribacter suum]|uniref:Cobalt-zinc-cadmium resistance protein n=1 Tax=Pulveribacter suum TaxID=2116657 RepID=A0A2P1NMN4_9BURK|nr:hypothetical protein [Pulveribacter suum]AVP58277.1 hypothetical protein C7H73_11800 [Pulveribacter suum]